MKPGTPYEAPETKVFLLLQAHFSRLQMPIPDYKTDLKMVLQQALRILQVSNIFYLFYFFKFHIIWGPNRNNPQNSFHINTN